MNPLRPLAALALFAAATQAHAQDVELFDRPDFGGIRLTVAQPVPDLAGYGLQQRVSSVIVHRGQWEFCTQPQWKGVCITVGPGRYGRLPPALNDTLASLRLLRQAPPQPLPPPTHPEPPGRAAIVLSAEQIPGFELPLADAVADLRRRDFNDTATHVDVRSGYWELCSDGGFSGECLRFGPGRHALPPALRYRLSSLRPVRDPGPDRPGRPDRPDRPGHPGRPWTDASPAVILYEHPGGGGRAVELHDASPNLGAMGFNDRASSVEILRGRWQLCRHADYQGECIVLGPGRHALDGPLQDNVSSVRPVWGRDDRTQRPHAALTLYDQLDLRGRSLFVDSPIENLRDLGFNDRAMAIEVHGGRWELCSSSYGRGRCVEFGPGWHRLPEGLARELTSLRPR